MFATLAAGNSLEELCQAVTGLFTSPAALTQPRDLLAGIEQVSIVWAVVLVIAGLLCLLSGHKFHKTAVVGIALCFGVFAGYALGQRIHAPAMIVAASLGLLLAVVAFPLMKYAVAVFGGLAGAWIGANLWAGIADAVNTANGTNTMPETYYIGALIGLIVCGMLAFIVFDLSVIMFTSVSGSTLAVIGALALIASSVGAQNLRQAIGDSRIVLPMLVFVPATIGLILQEVWSKNPAPAASASKSAKPAKA